MTTKNILFFGCSYTDIDSGYVDSDKMYPSLLGKHFNLPIHNYAENGKGNYRSFDLIANMHLKEEYLVVLQLTELSRIRWYDTKLRDVFLKHSTDRCLFHVYNDHFLIHECQRHIKLIVSLCRASKVKLIIWSIARFSEEQLHINFESFLTSFPEYIYLDNALDSAESYRVDNGYDGTNILGTGHPGPKSHSIIAQKLIEKIGTLYPNLIDK